MPLGVALGRTSTVTSPASMSGSKPRRITSTSCVIERCAGALLAAAVRARLRTLPFDPYRNVER
jgi:hypothetical protein